MRNPRKPQDEEPTRLLEKLTSKTLTIPNASKDAEQQEVSLIADGNAKRTATLEDSLAVTHKAQHSLNLMIQQSHS